MPYSHPHQDNKDPHRLIIEKKKMADSTTVKTSWADEVEVEELEPPKVEDYVDENGIRITIKHTVNDEGKKVKVRCRFRPRFIDG